MTSQENPQLLTVTDIADAIPEEDLNEAAYGFDARRYRNSSKPYAAQVGHS
jgi:hypothetical protein